MPHGPSSPRHTNNFFAPSGPAVHSFQSPRHAGIDRGQELNTSFSWWEIRPWKKMAEASFSAYVLVKMLLKTGEKVHFSTKKKHDQFWSSFFFLPFSLFFASKWLKHAVFAFQKAKNVGRKRGLRQKNI